MLEMTRTKVYALVTLKTRRYEHNLPVCIDVFGYITGVQQCIRKKCLGDKFISQIPSLWSENAHIRRQLRIIYMWAMVRNMSNTQHIAIIAVTFVHPWFFDRDLFCKTSCAYLLLGCRSHRGDYGGRDQDENLGPFLFWFGRLRTGIKLLKMIR